MRHSQTLAHFSCADPEGATGGPDPPPPGNHKKQGFLAILVRRPWKITNIPSQQSMLGHHRHANETRFKLRFAGGPMMARFKWYLIPLSPHQLKKKQQKNVVTVRPPLTKLSGSTHVYVF